MLIKSISNALLIGHMMNSMYSPYLQATVMAIVWTLGAFGAFWLMYHVFPQLDHRLAQTTALDSWVPNYANTQDSKRKLRWLHVFEYTTARNLRSSIFQTKEWIIESPPLSSLHDDETFKLACESLKASGHEGSNPRIGDDDISLVYDLGLRTYTSLAFKR